MATKASKTGKKSPAYLSKQTLLRAIKKGSRQLQADALRVQGYLITAKDGWVIKVNADGKTTKISRLKPITHPKKIVLD